MTSLLWPGFVLIRWLKDEALTVIPEKSVRQGGQTYVGAISHFRWCRKKCYEGKVLAKSGKNAQRCVHSQYIGLVLNICVGKYCTNFMGKRAASSHYKACRRGPTMFQNSILSVKKAAISVNHTYCSGRLRVFLFLDVPDVIPGVPGLSWYTDLFLF